MKRCQDVAQFPSNMELVPDHLRYAQSAVPLGVPGKVVEIRNLIIPENVYLVVVVILTMQSDLDCSDC